MRNLTCGLIVLAATAFLANAATLSVPGDHATVQAAINAAASGDTIEITDGATYNEDVQIPLGKDNLTIRGVGGRPTIVATNTVGRSIGTILVNLATSGAAPIGSPDSFGVFVEGNGSTFENLIITNNGPDPITGGSLFTSACTVVGDDTTFINCDFDGGGLGDNEFSLGNLCGNWPLLDAAVMAPAFAGAGYTTPTSADNCTLIDCNLLPSSNLFGVGDYSVFLISEVVDEYIPATLGQNWELNNCTLTGLNGQEIMEAAGLDGCTFNNCTIQGNPGDVPGADEFQVGGGTWTFNDCLFRDLPAGELLRVESIVEFGGGAANVFCNGTVFCGANDEAGIVRVDEGNLTLNNCIFNIQDLDGTAGLVLALADFDGQFVDTPTPGANFGFAGAIQSGIPHPATHGVIVNQCDFFLPFGDATAISIPDADFEVAEPDAFITITNSNIVSDGDAVSAGTVANGAGTLTVNNSNLFTDANQIAPGDWTLSTASILNEDPDYLDPLSCPDPNNSILATLYQYSNTNLATAGDSGQALGAIGPAGTPDSSIEDWSLYQ